MPPLIKQENACRFNRHPVLRDLTKRIADPRFSCYNILHDNRRFYLLFFGEEQCLWRLRYWTIRFCRF